MVLTIENIGNFVKEVEECKIPNEDNDYKELHRAYLLSDIQGDIDWYGTVYSQIGITNKLKIQNESPDQVVERLIFEYGLEKI